MRELIDKLEGLGFYKYTEPQLVEQAKAESRESSYLYVDAVGRSYLSDAEDLAEGGVKDFLDRIVPFLEKQNVKIESVEEDFNIGGGYSVTVNGRKSVIYTQEELETEEIWELTTVRTLSMINDLLKQAGSSERIYYLYGGNDLVTIFLTPEMYEAISQSSAEDEYEKPHSVEGEV